MKAFLSLCLASGMALPISLLAQNSVAQDAAATDTADDKETAADNRGMDNIELDTVEISGREAPLTRINVEKLLKVPGSGNDPLSAMRSLPGVTFGNGNSAEPAVRGSSPDDNDYLIDFIPVGYIFHSDSSSILNDNVIEDFLLETAAFPAQYNNATGAVIEATSRSPYYDRQQFVVDASFLKTGFFYEQPVNENQSFYIAARQSLFQYYIENFLDDEDFELTTLPEYYDYQGKYEIRINDTETVAFQAIGSRDKAGLKFEDDSDQVLQNPGLSGDLSFEAYFNSQGIVWDKLYNSGLSHKIGLSHLEQMLDINIGSAGFVRVKNDSYNLRSQFIYPLSYEHELQWGVEINEAHAGYRGEVTADPCDEFDPDCRLLPDAETVTGSGKPVIYDYDAHLGDAWSVTRNWTLTPAVAWAWDDLTEQTFIEPRLQSRWQFRDNWWFTQAYGHHHIRPDNISTFLPDFGNPDLKQPEAVHYELGLENQLRSDLFWKIELYYKELDHLIVAREAKEPLYSDLTDAEYLTLPRYTNEADGYAWGGELFVNKNLSERWYGWFSLAYSRTVRQNKLSGETFSYNYDQPVIINTVANYRLTSTVDVGLKWRYQSGQLITPLQGAEEDDDIAGLYNPQYGSLNSRRLPAYHRLDVRMDKALTTRRGWDLNLYAEVLNLYNRANVTGYQYEGADYSGKEKVTDLPLIVSFGVKAAF
ncbi:MAG: hypothetical protein CMI02_01100 [Oceanospirillaceae bacterium]|nr:hypothetical protein [Oceanospirillaceae bacterium]MBT10616.1 hypothetical protein [Oceanospirillaceae bacterium]